MLDVTVCIGSSCHLRGSYEVLDRLQKLIDKRKLQHALTLKASFCMGECTESVCVQVGADTFRGINGQNVDDLFNRQILARIAHIG